RRADVTAAARVLRQNVHYFSRMEPYLGLVPTRTGQHGGWHFWLYPLLALPAKALLRLAGGNPSAAFHLTTAGLFISALGIALFLVLYLLFVSWKECGLRRSVPAGMGALLALLPSLSSLYYFGVPNLIAARAGADFRLISWARTCSFVTDLNQGMLPFVPLLL